MIEIKNLSKSFPTPEGPVDALKNINLTIQDGEIYGIIGMSGAGKSTLVRCINGIELPSQGAVEIGGRDVVTMDKKELRAMRRNVAMIFQGFNLLMQRTCLKNVCFPLELAGVKKKDAKRRAMQLLEIVGLPDKANAYPAQLSGGQQQRVAIARALATDPQVLLCDEATSALDPQTTHNILELIREINKRTGITVIIITHQMSVVEEACSRVAILDHGTVAEEGEVSEIFTSPKSPAARRLVFPNSEWDMEIQNPDEHRIRIVFNGAKAAGTPIIAALAMEQHIAANILSASTRSIENRVYGNMLLGIPGSKEDVGRVLDYLSGVEDVFAEEVL